VDEIELKLRVRNSILMHRAQESIKQQSEMLEIYLRLMFHDFATPLTVGQFNLIKGISSLPPGTAIPQLTKASAALSRLVELTTDIKSFFQGTEPNQRVSTKKIIDDINSTFEDKLCERNVKLDILNETPTDSMINIPKSFLVHQIVGNFLSNAIKFSPVDGKIELQFCIVRDDSVQQNRMRIVIRDFGPGMNEEALSSFTRRRKRTATRGLSGEMGTGSGVMIAQFFLEKFLGTLQIESWCESNLTEKQGTKVTIFIPESVNKT
ncbi:MAG: sensor histidine kinase, partial [Proteobacteria bacterium]|nr:sensor histidine kinase [Pseudomonadota bacterium]